MDDNPRAGLAGGRLIGLDASWQFSAGLFPSLLNKLLIMSGLAARNSKSRFFGRSIRSWADPLQPASVDWVPGAFMIARREGFSKKSDTLMSGSSYTSKKSTYAAACTQPATRSGTGPTLWSRMSEAPRRSNRP